MARAKVVHSGIWRAWIFAWLGWSALQAQSSYEEYFDARNVPVIRGLLEKGDYENCLRACTIAIDRGLPSPEWPVLRIAVLAELGRGDEALAAAEDAMKTHGENLRVLMARQRLAASLGKKELALETLHKVNEVARKQNPKDRSGADLIALGQAALAAGADAQKVMTQFFEPAKKKPEVAAEASLTLGELALEKGDFARAANEFRAGLKLQPDSTALRYGLARAFESGDRGKCAGLLEQVTEVNPKHTGALVMQAEMNIGAEDFTGAADLLKRALEVNPQKPEAHALQAVLMLLTRRDSDLSDPAGTQPKAAGVYRMTLRSSAAPFQIATPGDKKRNWFVNEGQRFGSGDRFLAKEFTRKAVPDPMVGEKDVSELEVEDTVLKKTFKLIVGTEVELAVESPEPGNASGQRDAAFEPWSRNPAVDHVIGRCLSHAYRFAEGAEHQRRALEMDADYRPAKIQLCRDLLRLGQEEEAWKLAKEVRDADNYNTQAHNLGLLEKEMKRFITREQDGFVLRMPKEDEAVYADRALTLLRDARAQLGEKYGLKFDKPVLVEFFPSQQDFAIRTFGNLGGQGVLGACFGTVVTMNRPGGIEARRSNWESTLWHEFCHVVTLTVTKNRMPRWLSEGISVHEEGLRNPACGMRMNADYRRMILEEDGLTPIGELSGAFTNAKSGEHLMFAYFEASQVVDFMVRRFGEEKFRAILKDLGDGVRINEAIARHTESLDKLEHDFAGLMMQAAKNLASNADWSEPEDLDVRDRAAVTAYLQDHPRNLTALHQLSRQLLAEQDWEDALRIGRLLTEIFPTDVESGCGHEVAALAYRGLKQPSGEAAEFRAWAKASGDAASAYQRLMVLDAAAKDWRGLEESARWMLAVNPFLKQPHEALALALENLEQPDEAVNSLQKVLVLGADNPADTNYRLARLLQVRDREASRRHVLDALTDAPRHREALKLLEQLKESSDAPR